MVVLWLCGTRRLIQAVQLGRFTLADLDSIPLAFDMTLLVIVHVNTLMNVRRYMREGAKGD